MSTYWLKAKIAKYLFNSKVNKGYRWVDSLDRSSLGEFAVNRDVLAYTFSIMFYQTKKVYHKGYVINDLRVRLTEYLIPLTDGKGLHGDQIYSLVKDYRLEAEIEAHYWLIWSGKPVIATPPSMLEDHAPALAKLKQISSHDTRYHSYFAVGIWDEDLIKRLIADDIDPALALQLS